MDALNNKSIIYYVKDIFKIKILSKINKFKSKEQIYQTDDLEFFSKN